MIATLTLALLAGATNDVQTNPLLNEMAEAQGVCGTDGVTYVKFSDKPKDVYVLVANRVYSRRQEEAIKVALGCSVKVVLDRGYKPIMLGTKK